MPVYSRGYGLYHRCFAENVQQLMRFVIIESHNFSFNYAHGSIRTGALYRYFD